MDKKILKAIGSILVIIGLVLLFSNLRITAFSFSRMSGLGLIMAGLLIDGIFMVVKPNKAVFIIMALLVVALILLIIFNLRMFMRPISFFKMVSIIVLLALGVGLVAKGSMK